jgi:NADH:ubiquinone oxidoreductase subunit C
MYKSYLFPIQIFLILEKSNAIFWNSKTLIPNHFVCFIDSKWFYLINNIFKHELFLNSSTLIENTAIDMRFLNKNFKELDSFYNKQKLFSLYTYYFYNLKLRLTLLVNLKNSFKSSIWSIDKIYTNAHWLERETSEMYGIFFYWKNDTRKLLLDYSKIENPMLKDFPCEGFMDVFFNFFENQVTIHKNEIIEL